MAEGKITTLDDIRRRDIYDSESENSEETHPPQNQQAVKFQKNIFFLYQRELTLDLNYCQGRSTTEPSMFFSISY